MISAAQLKIKAAISALLEPLIPANQFVNKSAVVTAHRVGPNRVILKVCLTGDLEKYRPEKTVITPPSFKFGVAKTSLEEVTVTLAHINALDARFLKSKSEHKATLKVASETRTLALTFKDANGETLNSERVEIK
jgi:hypothetical protein